MVHSYLQRVQLWFSAVKFLSVLSLLLKLVYNITWHFHTSFWLIIMTSLPVHVFSIIFFHTHDYPSYFFLLSSSFLFPKAAHTPLSSFLTFTQIYSQLNVHPNQFHARIHIEPHMTKNMLYLLSWSWVTSYFNIFQCHLFHCKSCNLWLNKISVYVFLSSIP